MGGEVAGVDPARLEAWLERVTGQGQLEQLELIVGGRSNLTYRFRTALGAFILRRPPFGSLLPGAHDVEREHRIVEALHGTGVPVAEPIGFCDDLEIMGVPFSVTRFVEGSTLRTAEEAEQLLMAAPSGLAAPFARTLAALHQVDTDVTGRPVQHGADHVVRQLRVWTRQLDAPPVRPLPGMLRVASLLGATVPLQQRTCIVHGDYRLDNVRLGPEGDVRAVLDWELWTLGDPFVDLGIALTYWLEEPWELAALGSSPTLAPGVGGREQLIEAYTEAVGAELDEPRLWWYAAFGTWRFAAILEGVYRRNLAGAYAGAGDGDDDWRRFEYVVPALADQAGQLLRRGGWTAGA